MLYRYLLIAVACASVLIGIQIPNFIDQYEKRLDAHLIEVTKNLQGFKEIADKYHNGSFEELIREHERSDSPTFKAEARPLRDMYMRWQAFLREQQNLNTHLAGKAAHIAFSGHPELVDETYRSYSYSVPLTRDAVFAGLIFTALAVILIEVVAKLTGLLFRRRRRAAHRGY